MSLAQGQAQTALVLVADDCPFNIFAMQGLLEQLNVQAEFVTNGEEAVQAVRKRLSNSNNPMYKLIMMDFSMPIMNGPDATRKIRAMLEKKGFASDDPVICLVTAYQERSKQLVAEEAGMTSFLIKPIFKGHMHRVLIKAGLIK